MASKSRRWSNFAVRSRFGFVDSLDHLSQAHLHDRPAARRKYDQRYLATGEILLIPDVAVCCDHHFIAGDFRSLQQVAVLELFPADLNRAGYKMMSKEPCERTRGVLIKKNFHVRSAH